MKNTSCLRTLLISNQSFFFSFFDSSTSNFWAEPGESRSGVFRCRDSGIQRMRENNLVAATSRNNCDLCGKALESMTPAGGLQADSTPQQQPLVKKNKTEKKPSQDPESLREMFWGRHTHRDAAPNGFNHRALSLSSCLETSLTPHPPQRGLGLPQEASVLE